MLSPSVTETLDQETECTEKAPMTHVHPSYSMFVANAIDPDWHIGFAEHEIDESC